MKIYQIGENFAFLRCILLSAKFFNELVLIVQIKGIVQEQYLQHLGRCGLYLILSHF